MNAATAPGQSQTVEQARERARQKAAQITEQMAVAKTAAAVRAILDTLPGANQVGELTPDDLARLTEHGQSLEPSRPQPQ
ncbi:MAG: hypothetical protein HYT31_02905 [Parcubacteria group bacterium]|nr:hypothetical protein [Parcubacteria group bacterium]